jgi:hypothetical protein
MFKQKYKKKKRMTTCSHPKHVFKQKAKSKCSCGNYYKENGRIFRSKGDIRVVGNSSDFHYKGQKPTKKSLRRKLKKILRK